MEKSKNKKQELVGDTIEGPEIKRMVEFINDNLEEVQTINVADGYKRVLNDYERFKDSLPLDVEEISCKGKFVYFILEGNWYIWHHMGMNGRWYNQRPLHHCRLWINNSLFYWDDCCYGTFKFMYKKYEALRKKLSELGPDMLDEVDDDLFIERMRTRPGKTVVEMIMDQSIISGCGNYIKSEALYRAGISPHRIIDDMDDDDLMTLNYHIQDFIQECYDVIEILPDGTITSDEYEMQVYGLIRDIEGNKVIKETTKDDRATYWVREVQK